MDRCQTILPPPPPPMTAFRATLGALWFRISSAGHRALRVVRRAPTGPRRLATGNAPATPILSLHALTGQAGPTSAQRVTPEDDRWLRPTQVLPLQG